MGIARKWIFPISRILIFMAIAAALLKLAFFSGAITAADETQPTGRVTEPVVAVETGTITNDVTLKATVAADAAVPIKATLAGEVKKVLVTAGQSVVAATPVLTLRSETAAVDGTPIIKTVTVLAGSVGILSSLPVIPGQLVAVGDALGQVAPPTFSVSGSLAAEQQYRLLNRPTEAKVTITGGPAPFTCTGLTITAPLAGSTTGDSGTPGDSSSGTAASGTTIRCAIPAGVTVFGGLAAVLTVSGGVAENVLVLPVTAVEGTAQNGVVYSMKPDGTTEKHPVTLGLSDSKNVEISTGVAKGDEILQFVPGAPAANCNSPQNNASEQCPNQAMVGSAG